VRLAKKQQQQLEREHTSATKVNILSSLHILSNCSLLFIVVIFIDVWESRFKLFSGGYIKEGDTTKSKLRHNYDY